MRQWLFVALALLAGAPCVRAEGGADFVVQNRCDFPVEITHSDHSNFRRRTLGMLRAFERRTFRGALSVGRNEVLFAIALDVPNNLVRKTFLVNNPGPGKRARRVTIELTPTLFDNPTIPRPKLPPQKSGGKFQGRWYSEGRGTFTLTQSGTTLKGSLLGIAGEHWGPVQRDGGTITEGSVDEATGVATLKVTWGDGTHSTLTMKLSEDGKRFDGIWKWKGAEGPWGGIRGTRPPSR